MHGLTPIFLYNSLDAIDWYIRSDNRDASINLIQSLAIFYRKSLNLGSDVVTVAEELLHLELYIAIERLLDNGVYFNVQVPDEIRLLTINAMTLQPLVENSIQHGPDENNHPLHITVSGYISQQKAILVVEDTGVGFPIAVAEAFNQHRHIPDRPAGVGLVNVHSRL